MSKLKNGLDFFLYLVNEQSDHLVVSKKASTLPTFWGLEI